MKITVIGCGSIGRRHAENAREMGCQVSVVDINTSLAKQVATEIDVTFNENVEDALDTRPDKVIIAVPNRLHIHYAEQAVESGADVLIEKPISHQTENVSPFLAKAEKFNKRVFVGCNMRFHPGVSLLHENLKNIGKPLFARAHVGNYLPNMRPDSDYRQLYCSKKREGGGVILDAIHEIDYLTYFFNPVNEYSATAAKLSDLDIDVEDYACLGMRHKSGVVSEIHLDYLRPFKRRGCEIVGSKGMLLWQSEGKQPEKCIVKLYQSKTSEWKTVLRTDKLDAAKPYKVMLNHFINDSAEGNHSPLLTGQEALNELKVALQARKSAEFTKL